jgi:hypothetical protein
MLAAESFSPESIHPRHRDYFKKLQKNPQLLDIAQFEKLQDPGELKKLRDEARPEMDVFDMYLGLVRKGLDVSEAAAFECLRPGGDEAPPPDDDVGH